MKYKSVRAIGLLLAILSVLSVGSVGLTGCVTAPPDGSETESDGTLEPDNADTVFQFLESDIQKTNYDREITQLYRGPDQRMSHEIYMANGASNGDRIDYAVYQKNKKVEDYLGVRFRFVAADGSSHGFELVKQLKAEIRVGNDTYQIVSNSNYGMQDAILDGSFLNLKNVKNLDLSKKYWAQRINENAEVSDAVFGITGSISLYLYQELFVVFFNKELVNEFGIDPKALYQTVSDGAWTLDYMINLTKNIYRDTNQNGTTDAEDLYGMAMQLTSAVNGFWSACDIRMTTKTETGALSLDVDIQKVYQVVSKLNSYVWNQPGVLRIVEDSEAASPSKGLYSEVGSVLVGNSRVLFATDRLYEVRQESLFGTDRYGVLPYPKYNARSKYASCAHDSYTVFSVPVTAKEESDICGAVLEYLAVTNHNVVMPTYYDEVLNSDSHDPLAVKTLNIIFQNIQMDSGLQFSIGGLSNILMSGMIMNRLNNVSSVYDSTKSAIAIQCRRISTLYARYASNGADTETTENPD